MKENVQIFKISRLGVDESVCGETFKKEIVNLQEGRDDNGHNKKELFRESVTV